MSHQNQPVCKDRWYKGNWMATHFLWWKLRYGIRIMVAILGKSMNPNKSLSPLQEGQATKGGYKDVVRLFREKIRRTKAFDCQGVLLTHAEPTGNQHTQILFYRAALQPLISQSLLVSSITTSQVQDLALVLITFHAVADGLMLQSLWITLQSLFSLRSQQHFPV